MINLAYPKFRDKKRPSRQKIWVFGGVFLLVFLATAATWYFLIFQKKVDFTGQAVKIKITAPLEVVAGSSYEYFIEYSNQEEISLQNAKLVIYFPPGFNLVDSLPSPEEREELWEANVAQKVSGESSSRTWNLGVLEPKSKDAIKLKGIFLGEAGSIQPLKVSLSYQPENFSSHFSSEEGANFKVKEAALDFSLEIPEKVGKNKEFDLVVKYKNVSTEDLENVQILLTYPRNFVFVSGEPRPDKENSIWDLRLLRRGEKGRLDIRGKMISAEAPAIFQAQIGILDQYKQFLSQVKKEVSLIVLDPVLEMTVMANQEEEINLNPGDELDFVITYNNVGKSILENGKIIFQMETDLLDMSSIEVEDGHYDAEEFVWDYTTRPALLKINPGENGNVKFKAKLLPVFPYSSADKRNLALKGKAYFESNRVEGVEGFEFKAESNGFVGNINTEASLVQEARYHNFDYEQVGSGPLPPKVGEKTTYRIYWTVTNTTSDVEDLRIEMVLPPAVFWENDSFVSLGGNLEYDPLQRKVVWKLGRLPAFSGSLFPGAQGWFMVGIIPKAEEVGQVLPLTEKTLITGRDLFTEVEIEEEYPSLNTDLKNDLGALGKGEVVK